MYQSNRTCPDCGHTLNLTWRWPAIILRQPVDLVFICENCDGQKKELPEVIVPIIPEGLTVLERNLSVYNKALVYMAATYFPINPNDYNPVSVAYNQGYSDGLGMAHDMIKWSERDPAAVKAVLREAGVTR